jgi:hypothetical protein
VAAGAALPEGVTVTLTISVANGVFSDTEKMRIVIGPPTSPTLNNTNMPRQMLGSAFLPDTVQQQPLVLNETAPVPPVI